MKWFLAAALALAVLFVGFGVDQAVAKPGTHTLLMKNDMKKEAALRLFIDEETTHRCEAAWHQSCSAQVESGIHQITVRRVSDGKQCSGFPPVPISGDAEISMISCGD